MRAQQRADDGQRHRQQPAAAMGGAQDEPGDVAVGQHVGAGQLVAGVAPASPASSTRMTQSATSSAQIGCVRALPGAAAAASTGSSASRSRRCRRRSPGAYTSELASVVVCRPDASHGPLRERLRAVDARVVVRRGAERRQPDEPLRAGPLGGAQQPRGGQPVDLLDRRARLVALARRQVDDDANAAQRVAPRRRVGQVADRELHAHALGAEPPRVAHQAAHRLAARREASQHGDPTSPVAPVSRSTPGA